MKIKSIITITLFTIWCVTTHGMEKPKAPTLRLISSRVKTLAQSQELRKKSKPIKMTGISYHHKEIINQQAKRLKLLGSSSSAPPQIIGLHLLFTTIVAKKRISNLNGVPKINWPYR